MKKKVLFVTLLFSLVLSAAACNNQEKNGGTDAKETTAAQETAQTETTAAPQSDATAAPQTDETAAPQGDAEVATQSEELFSPEEEALLSVKLADKGEVELGEYKEITVEYEPQEDTESIDDNMNWIINYTLKNDKTVTEIKDRAAEKGDTVNINYKGTKDGKTLDNLSAEKTDVVIGKNVLPDGFEDELIGTKVGETKTFQITFPETHTNTELAGQEVEFEVKINSIRVEETPELTDEYVTKKSKTCKTVDEYKTMLKEMLTANKEYQEEEDKLDACIMAAAKNATVKALPKKEFRAKMSEWLDFFNEKADSMHMTLEEFAKNMAKMTKEDFLKYVEVYYVRMPLMEEVVLQKIIETEKLTLTEEEYKDNFELFKTVNLCETDEDLLEQYSEKELREKFLQRKAKKLIEENATIVAPTEAPEQQ